MDLDPSTCSADELLAALVARDIVPEDARVQARFAADPDLGARFSHLAATLDLLSAAGDEIEAARAAATAPSRVDPEAAIRAFRRQQARPRRMRLLVGGVALAAALLLLLVWGWLPGGERQSAVEDPHLGGQQTVLAPDGVAWQEGEPLHWQAVRGADSYRLELRPVPSGPTITVPGPGFPNIELRATAWLPSAPERSSLPTRFRWRVIAVDSSNRGFRTSVWAETWR